MIKWNEAHKYHVLVTNGIAQQFKCHKCELEMIFSRGTNDEPRLWCLSCDSRYIINHDQELIIKAITGEFYV